MNLELITKLRQITSAGMNDCKTALQETNDNLEAAIDLIKARGKNNAANTSSKVASEGMIVVGGTEQKSVLVELNTNTDFTSRSPAFTSFANLVGQRLGKEDLTSFKGDLTPFNETVDGKETNLETMRQDIMSTTKENVVVRRWFEQSVFGDNRRVFNYIHSNNKLGVLVAMEGPNKEVVESSEFIEFGNNVAMQIAGMSPLAVSADQIPQTEVDRQKAIFETQFKESGKKEEQKAKILEGKMRKWYSEVALLNQESVLVPKTTIQMLAEKLGATVLSFSRVVLGDGLEIPETKDYATEIAEMTGVKLEQANELVEERSETVSSLN